MPVLIILSFLGLGLTLFAPSLSLSGSTTVVQGGTFTLHGSHFMPGSSVTLTLDDTIPLYFSSRSLPIQTAHTANTTMQILGMDTQSAQQLNFSNNTVSVGGDGTFAVTITANPGWSIGKHTIKASESPTHRSTSLNFTIYLAGTTPGPTTTGGTSPTPSPTGSCFTNSITYYDANTDVYDYASRIKLCQPIFTFTWSCNSRIETTSLSAGYAMHNRYRNSKLDSYLGSKCGTLGPSQSNFWANFSSWTRQVIVSALASNLTPGNYSVTVAFSSQPDNKTQSLQVAFTVQGGCASGNPNTLSYSGVANTSDAGSQTVTITNCGPTGSWSASTQTNNGGNWLFANPTSGTLNAGTSNNVTITASNLKAQLAAGTYTGNVTFKIGTGTFTVRVTLTVMSAPILSGTPTNQQCIPNNAGYYICYVSLTNNSNTLNLKWFASTRTKQHQLQSGQQYSLAGTDHSCANRSTDK